jgi:uncharacterized protein (TIGR03435 family)
MRSSLLLAAALALQATSTQPSFEVASVKQNKSGTGFVQIAAPGGQFKATNVPLRMLIRNAYQLQDFQIIGAPSWVDTDRFDINAKAEGDPGPAVVAPGQPGPIMLMIRSLLADRFKLKVHTETREMPIYALVLTRSDGKLGSALNRSTTDCAALRAASRNAPPPVPAPGERMMCGMRIAPGMISGGGIPLSQLATQLSVSVQRIVVDKTGLGGDYDFDLKWTPDQLPQGTPPPGAPPLPPIDPNGPSIYTAVQEQLGLKLDSQRGPVNVLVIDGVEHPTED